jgi:hypothetical protein
MTYIKVDWIHSNADDPVLLYSELDEGRWEKRKVEIFADGRRCYANSTESTGSTRLGEEPIPPLAEIASDQEFMPMEISKQEFEEVWAGRKT